jgi:hypothetical protein
LRIKGKGDWRYSDVIVAKPRRSSGFVERFLPYNEFNQKYRSLREEKVMIKKMLAKVLVLSLLLSALTTFTVFAGEIDVPRMWNITTSQPAD